MMRELNCGDVVAGCDRKFRGLADDVVLELASEHAAAEHGVSPTDYNATAAALVRGV